MIQPNNNTPAKTLRLAALGDLHCKASSQGRFKPLFSQIAQSADVLVLCGDLTDHGLPAEAEVLVKEMSGATGVPIVAVLGNHDFESNQANEINKILRDGGMQLLDGDAIEVQGIGFAGVKGFAGGFGRGTLSAFGEQGVKRFVQEALDEVMKLESALLRLRTSNRIAVLHYAPIRDTVEGEPLEIFPFLGCGRLEEPINRYQVTACVHGHAHNGAAQGKTAAGVPVYNVSLPLMRRDFPEQALFRILELPVAPPVASKGREAVVSQIQ